MGEHARTKQPRWPGTETGDPYGITPGAAVHHIGQAASQDQADTIPAPQPPPGSVAVTVAVSVYNRERTRAFTEYRAAVDAAWLAYLTAMHQAEIAYEQDVTALGAAFEQAMNGGDDGEAQDRGDADR